jgi:hypothetical protein
MERKRKKNNKNWLDFLEDPENEWSTEMNPTPEAYEDLILNYFFYSCNYLN